MFDGIFIKYIIILCFLNVLINAQDNLSTTTTTTTTTRTTTTNKFKRSLRLPNNTYPLHYQLHLQSNLHLSDFTYWGIIKIDVQVRETTDEIVLHAKELRDFIVRIRDLPSWKLRNDIDYSYYPKASFLVIHTTKYEHAFIAGQMLRLEIKFKGDIQSQARGIYWLEYTLAPNQTIYLAATQFEPTSARLAFPCYDEPALKANFSLIITHSTTYEVIANMPVLTKQKHVNDELITTKFETTPPISTYLIAFVLYKNFNFISEKYRGVEQRVFTHINATSKGERALQNAVLTVATIEDYFGVKYALNKLDHIALNKNYGSAMENWGLITYKDNGLVYDNVKQTHYKDILTVTHEITHQWFGNLVSPEWWTYAWLNEGFATYFSYVLTDKMHPEYKVMELFITDVTDRAFSYSQIAERPMTQYVESETEILSIFDMILYQKAACVIKMFHHAFKEDTFMHGLNIYLQKYKYSYANENNLFDALQAAISFDSDMRNQTWANRITEIMQTWTHSLYIPMISIKLNKDNTITLKQRARGPHIHKLWWIPLNFATRSTANFEDTSVDYFMPPIQNVTIKLEDFGLSLNTGDWLIANKQQTGLYHVHYDANIMQAIAQQLIANHTKLHAFNRAAIFQDLTPLIENNAFESMTIILDLLKYLEFEENLLPWNHVGDLLLLLEKKLYGTSSHELYKSYIRRLVTPMFHKLHKKPLEKDATSFEAVAREKIIEISCMTDLEDCFSYIKSFTYDFIMGKTDSIEVRDMYNLYDTPLCLSAKHLNSTEFNTIMGLLAEANRTSDWFLDLSYALRCMKNETLLEQLMTFLIPVDAQEIDNDSVMYLFYMYKTNLGAQDKVLDFIQKHYIKLCQSEIFLENFNRFAEYISEQHRKKFNYIRDGVAVETNLNGKHFSVIEANSTLIGKKMKTSEKFVKQFGDEIHSWLQHYFKLEGN